MFNGLPIDRSGIQFVSDPMLYVAGAPENRRLEYKLFEDRSYEKDLVVRKGPWVGLQLNCGSSRTGLKLNCGRSANPDDHSAQGKPSHATLSNKKSKPYCCWGHRQGLLK